MKRQALAFALSTFAILLSAPSHAEDPVVDSVAVTTEDGDASISLGLDAQVRYAVRDRDGLSREASFKLRRLRPILKFQGFEQLEVTIVPEFAGAPELKDGVIAWAPNDHFKIEAGQFAPPFNWERDGSSDYHQFTERSVANAEFQIADGRDIGAQFDFEWGKWLDVEAGVFNGAGSNAQVEPGTGNVLSGRVAVAPFGYYHEVEVVPKVLDEALLMVGLGAYAAFDNAWRDWAPPSHEVADTDGARADVWSVSADAHVWAWRLSLHATVFHRVVKPCCERSAIPNYRGSGFTGQAGFLIVGERLMVAFRHSQSSPNRARSMSTEEYAVAIQSFHHGNESKFTLETGAIDRELPGGADEEYVRLQYQLLL